MAGGGQMRPMGGQVGSLSGQPPLMRRGGTEPQFQAGFGARIPQNMGQDIGTKFHNTLPDGTPLSSGGVAGVDFPRRGEEGSFYGQQAQPFTPSIAPQGNFNVNQAAAGGLQQAMQGTQQAMNFAPMAIRPSWIHASTADGHAGHRNSPASGIS